MMPTLSPIGPRIRAAREAVKPELTQADLARRLGVSSAQMWTWEAGRRVPRLPTLTRIADCLEVSLDYLLRGEVLAQTAEAS